MSLTSFKHRLLLASLISGAVALFIGLTGPGSWAAPGYNPAAQTIPTRPLATPTDLPAPAPTNEPTIPAVDPGDSDDGRADAPAPTATTPPANDIEIEPQLTPTSSATSAPASPPAADDDQPVAATATNPPANSVPPPAAPQPTENDEPDGAPTATATAPAVAGNSPAAGQPEIGGQADNRPVETPARPPTLFDRMFGQGRWLTGLCLGGILLLGGVFLVRRSFRGEA